MRDVDIEMFFRERFMEQNPRMVCDVTDYICTPHKNELAIRLSNGVAMLYRWHGLKGYFELIDIIIVGKYYTFEEALRKYWRT